MHNFYQAAYDVKVGSGHNFINIGHYDVANVLFINTVKAIKIQLI